MSLRCFASPKSEKQLRVETFWGQVESASMRQLKSAPGKVFEGSVSTSPKKEIRYLVIYVYMRSNGVSEKGGCSRRDVKTLREINQP